MSGFSDEQWDNQVSKTKDGASTQVKLFDSASKNAIQGQTAHWRKNGGFQSVLVRKNITNSFMTMALLRSGKLNPFPSVALSFARGASNNCSGQELT